MPQPQPWLLRKTCGECRFFLPPDNGVPVLSETGECWRYPPRVDFGSSNRTVQPERTAKTPRCGEWRGLP